jgi:hypothetical protein
MKKIYIPIITLLFSYISSVAQVEVQEGLLIADSYPGGLVETRKLEKSSVVEGSFFINNDWTVGNVILYNGKAIKGMPLKYNLRDEVLLLLDKNQVSRLLRDDQIEKFEWFDSEKDKNMLFINCLEYELNGVPMVGFLELLSTGKVDLLLYRTLTLQEGYYSVTHDAGQLNDEYKINEIFYLSSEKSMVEIKNKKALYEYTGDHAGEIKSYVKKNKLRLKDPDDLTELINYYNSILE